MGSEIKDPGIGTQFQQNTKRIINPDGTYNIIKKGSRKGFRDFFKYMLDISWLRFFLILFLSYILLNIFFTLLYILAGNAAIDGIRSDGAHPILQTFYFSVQTFTTVGYGSLSPVGVFAQSVASVEAFVGFLSFSLATGLAYGRFSKPNSKIIFSKFVLYSKYQDGYSIKVKLANERDNVLLEVTAKMILTLDKVTPNGEVTRSYYNLPLEIDKVELLPFTWTLVHKIDEESPFYGKKQEELRLMNPEFLVIIKGFDETFSQHVHSKQSFICDDMRWNKRFMKIFGRNEEGVVEFDINNINDIADDEI